MSELSYYSKNVTGNYHVDNSSQDSDSDEGDVCSSDELLAAGPWDVKKTGGLQSMEGGRLFFLILLNFPSAHPMLNQ